MPEQDEDRAAAAAGTAGFAPAPVSTRLMSGNVTVRGYMDSWLGDDSDIVLPDRTHMVSGIDMMAWAVAFLDAVDALFAPEMAAAIAALDPDRAASLAAHKRHLADAIAGTLIPVLIVPGQVPAIEPARAAFREALLASLAAAYAPDCDDDGPLRAFPQLPMIGDVRAVTAQSPSSIAGAFVWDCVVTVATPQAKQDALLLRFIPNAPSARPADPVAEAAAVAVPPRPAAASLFEALGRMTFEYPRIAPHLAQVLAGGDAAVARAALGRVEALIGDVVLTWPDWFARALPTAADAGYAPEMDQAFWAYRVDFGQRPALQVARAPLGDHLLPPWPEIAGFVTPPEESQTTARYQRSTGAVAEAALTFTWSGLPIVQAQRAEAAASVTRNEALVPAGAPDGTRVDPAFIFRTPMVTGAEPVSPFADLPSRTFRIGEGAATLSAALDALFAPLLAAPSLAGLAGRDVRIEIEASYRASPGGGDAAVDRVTPIFLTRTTLALSPDAADGAVPPTAFRRHVIDALVAWHAGARPDDTGAAIRFAVTLSATDAEDRAPLVSLGQIDAIVPDARADWWR